MTYVYDILLNFNKDLIEYFEWEDNDNIKYAKKITLFRIDKKTMKDFLCYDIELPSNFIKDTLRYELDGLNDKISYTLFTDTEIVLGVSIKNSKIDLLSRLIIDEEDEIIDIAKNLEEFNISYKVLKRKEKSKGLLTRNELKTKKTLRKEIEDLYIKKNKDKLEYLYYEFTGQECKNINSIYNFLVNSLDHMTEKHLKLFEIIKLSSKKI